MRTQLEGLSWTWAEFEKEVLAMPWEEFEKLGGTPSIALARLQNFSREPDSLFGL